MLKNESREERKKEGKIYKIIILKFKMIQGERKREYSIVTGFTGENERIPLRLLLNLCVRMFIVFCVRNFLHLAYIENTKPKIYIKKECHYMNRRCIC